MIETSAVVAITARLYSMRATLFASAHQTSTSVHHIPPPDLSTIVSLLSVRSVTILV